MNVYVIASEGGMCKIGKANDPAARMAALATGHPYKLTVAGVFPFPTEREAYDAEYKAHEMLKTKRMVGEWFMLSAQDACAAIETLCPKVERELTAWQRARLANFAKALGDCIAEAADLLAKGATTEDVLVKLKAKPAIAAEVLLTFAEADDDDL